MSDDSLVVILTIAIMIPTLAVGVWLALKLVRGSELRQDQPRLKRMMIGIWIAGIVAAGAWLVSGGKLTFENACFGFGLASIAIFAAFRRPKIS